MKLARSKKLVLLTLISLTIPYTLYPIPSIKAQEVTQETKKNVVKNFKANLSEYSAFGSNCDQKSKGDANCDGNINEFDLSIWQVEFNTSSNPKRSDFNNDGTINLLDYGIWRNTTYPQKTSGLKSFFASAFSIFNLKSLISSIYAQETASGGSEINSSSSFTTSSGTSMVVNSLDDGNTQQLNFDQFGNPQTAGFYNGNGESYANVSFLNSGSTIISTQESGLPVSITQTSAGPVIENFRNSDGSLLAIKTWPTAESYTRSDPPQAVTLPGQGSTKEVLNMQPNGDAIIEKIDASGNVLSRSQLRSNDTIVTENFQNKIIVQSNSRIGFTTLSMKNNLGGNTSYMFYQGSLYAITQTKDSNTSYIAKPVDQSGNSWSFETIVNDSKSQKTVTDPIAEVNGGTPNPKELIANINILKQASPSASSVNFSDAYTSPSTTTSSAITKANTILNISMTQTPAVLGLVKEAKAQQSGTTITQTGSTQINEGTPFQATSYDFSVVNTVTNQSIGNYSITVPDNPIQREDSSLDYGSIRGTGIDADGRGLSQQEWSTARAANGNPVSSVNDLATFGIGVPENTTPAQPAAPAVPAAPGAPAAPAQPAAPANNTGGTSLNHQTGTTISESARSAAAQASDAKDAAGGTPAQNAAAAYAAARSVGADPNQASVLFADAYMVSAIRDAKNDPDWNPAGLNLVNEAAKAGLNSSNVVGSALNTLNGLRSADGAAAVTNATSIQSFTGAAGNTSQSTATAPSTTTAAAASVAVSLPSLGASMSFGNGMTSTITGYNDLNSTRAGYEGFSSTITDASGTVVATQISDPSSGRSEWSDQITGDTYNANYGALTSITTDVSAENSIVGISAADGSVVAVGDASFVNSEGFIEGGRPATEQEITAFQQQQAEQFGATGVDQYNTSIGDGPVSIGNTGTCFLPGTHISTPSGPLPIESLKPGTKVYSYNEKTGQKQISDFEKLDINFVDEYLVINGKIKTTIYHPFYIAEDNSLKTIRADELKIGDILLSDANQKIPVYSIEKISSPSTTVYNLLNVSLNNNFFAEGILVHNYGGGGSGSVDDTSSSNQDVSSEATNSDVSGDGAGSGSEPSYDSDSSYSDSSYSDTSYSDNSQGSVDSNSSY
jgi:hypothetical protein